MRYAARPDASIGGDQPLDEPLDNPIGEPPDESRDKPPGGSPGEALDESRDKPPGEALDESRSLDERSRRLLDFERQWWRRAGAKEQAIRDAFEISPTRYYQLLNALLDDPAALEHDAVLVQRLRRLRASRRRHRA